MTSATRAGRLRPLDLRVRTMSTSALDTGGATTNNRPNMSASLISASTGRLQARYGFAYFGA